MMRSKLVLGLVVGCVLAGLVGVDSAGADPDPYIYVNGDSTGVHEGCARTGTQTQMGVNAHWQRVPDNYDVDAFDSASYHTQGTGTVGENLTGQAETVTECAQDILDYLTQVALDEAHDPASVTGNEAQVLRNELFSGTAHFARPYEVFLNNLYLTGPMLASLSTDQPGTGLDSCVLSDNLVLIECQDDGFGSIVLRDQWGTPLTDLNGVPLEFNLNGVLSQRGATMYGSVFLANTDAPGGAVTMSGNPDVERHEQTHAQQWAQWGWDFGGIYIAEELAGPGDRVWHFWQTGQIHPVHCFNAFERAAHFHKGGYTDCPATWVDYLPNPHPSWTA